MAVTSDDAKQLATEAEKQKESPAASRKRGAAQTNDAEDVPVKRGRGRPPKPEHLRKTKPYEPTGRPRGRPKLPESAKKAKKPSSGLGRGRPAGTGAKVKKVKAAATGRGRGRPKREA